MCRFGGGILFETSLIALLKFVLEPSSVVRAAAFVQVSGNNLKANIVITIITYVRTLPVTQSLKSAWHVSEPLFIFVCSVGGPHTQSSHMFMLDVYIRMVISCGEKQSHLALQKRYTVSYVPLTQAEISSFSGFKWKNRQRHQCQHPVQWLQWRSRGHTWLFVCFSHYNFVEVRMWYFLLFKPPFVLVRYFGGYSEF